MTSGKGSDGTLREYPVSSTRSLDSVEEFFFCIGLESVCVTFVGGSIVSIASRAVGKSGNVSSVDVDSVLLQISFSCLFRFNGLDVRMEIFVIPVSLVSDVTWARGEDDRMTMWLSVLVFFGAYPYTGVGVERKEMLKKC